MKKMTKGAIVTGLGVTLLLGGGGTLAVWNQDAVSNAGTVVAGDLNLKARKGQWSSNVSGNIDKINKYRVIPGETLTYTQDLTVTLEGDEMLATLEVIGDDVNKGFTPENVDVSEVTLTGSNGAAIPATGLTKSGVVTAQTTFDFLSTTTDRDSVRAKYDFSGISYKLQQVAPTPLG